MPIRPRLSAERNSPEGQLGTLKAFRCLPGETVTLAIRYFHSERFKASRCPVDCPACGKDVTICYGSERLKAFRCPFAHSTPSTPIEASRHVSLGTLKAFRCPIDPCALRALGVTPRWLALGTFEGLPMPSRLVAERRQHLRLVARNVEGLQMPPHSLPRNIEGLPMPIRPAICAEG
jgi:hypothetical protein